MDFFSLVRSSGLACTDGPDGFVGNDDVLELLGSEVEHAALKFGLDHLVLLVGLTLFKALADAEDDLQAVFQSEQHLFLQDFGCLAIIATTL